MGKEKGTHPTKLMPILPKSVFRGVQPVASVLHAARDGYECGPTQNHKFTENIMIFVCNYILQCINVWPKTTLPTAFSVAQRWQNVGHPW